VRISVALATHDGERYLAAQLRSLARQTLPPAELVIYDDGSSDGTVVVAERFAAEAPFPVRLIPGRDSVGPHEAFMRAAMACSAESIAFCDQDDIWLDGKLERCSGALGHGGVLLALHAASVVRHDLSPTGRRCPSISAERVAEAGAVDPLFTTPGFAMVFRRSVLAWGDWAGRPASRYWRGGMTHDEWIALLATSAGRTAFISQPLVLYRQHPAQLFGAARRGPRETAARWLTSAPEAHEQVADLRVQHGLYLRALADAIRDRGGDPHTAEMLERSAARREGSADLWRRRANVYDRRIGRRERIARMAELARDGGYRGADAGGLGRHALVRDLTYTLTR
jgi:glycosyltransferase involved in cell wall biosynthesis